MNVIAVFESFSLLLGTLMWRPKLPSIVIEHPITLEKSKATVKLECLGTMQLKVDIAE
jgi:hypothetical protein